MQPIFNSEHAYLTEQRIATLPCRGALATTGMNSQNRTGSEIQVLEPFQQRPQMTSSRYRYFAVDHIATVLHSSVDKEQRRRGSALFHSATSFWCFSDSFIVVSCSTTGMDGVRQFVGEIFAQPSRNSRRLNLEKEIEELKFEEVSEAFTTDSIDCPATVLVSCWLV